MFEDVGLFTLRAVLGLLIAAHGSQKLFGWFGGYGLAGTAGYMGSVLRLRPAGLWTATGAVSEFAGGILLALGLATGVGAAAVAAAMLTAVALAHWPRLWSTDNGMEYPLVAGVAAAAVGLIGPGAWSLDAALGLTALQPGLFLAGLAAGVLGAGAALVTRIPEAAALPGVEISAEPEQLRPAA